MAADVPPDYPPRPSETLPGVQPRWGLGDAAVGFLVGLTLSAVLGGFWLAATGDEELSLAGQAVSQLGLWAGLVGCVGLASRWKGRRSLVADFGFTGRGVDLAVGLAVGLLSQIVLVPALAFLLRPLLGDPDVSGPAEELFEQASGIASPILFLFVVVGAAVVEELFFRGLVLRSLQRRFGSTPAILLSAMLFAIAHPQPLPARALALVMISLFAFGVVLAILAVRTGRLGASIVAHAAFNAWTATLLLTS